MVWVSGGAEQGAIQIFPLPHKDPQAGTTSHKSNQYHRSHRLQPENPNDHRPAMVTLHPSEFIQINSPDDYKTHTNTPDGYKHQSAPASQSSATLNKIRWLSRSDAAVRSVMSVRREAERGRGLGLTAKAEVLTTNLTATPLTEVCG